MGKRKPQARGHAWGNVFENDLSSSQSALAVTVRIDRCQRAIAVGLDATVAFNVSTIRFQHL